MQATLNTRRLVLRPRELADTDACLRMDLEPEVTRYVSGPWSDPVAHRAFIEQRTRGPYLRGLGYWTLRLGDRTAEFIGWVLLIPLDAIGPEIEIGWRLRPAFWGRGYATEAANSVLRHGFADLGLDELVADIDPANIASIGVAERIGLRHREAKAVKDRTLVRYALTRTEAEETSRQS
ncbi:GNAT family N-acetyltransferase [Roseiarcus sp.]|uniref:GNAT family N-acetyltransferase n=1 Tax=Roseiarcus sp. TaxID=1969460 RepID=UPI003F9AF1E3